MQGEWQLHKMINNGEALAADLRKMGFDVSLEIVGDQWTQTVRLPVSGGEDEEQGTLTIKKVDEGKSPKQIILAGEYGDVISIYRLDGDTLTVRVGGVGVAPTHFNSSPTTVEGENEILVFTRKKP
jgi:uncharacterized protein (TIGR03067 family)